MIDDFQHYINEQVLLHISTAGGNANRISSDKINFRCMFCGDSKKSMTKKRGWYYLSTCSFFCFNCNTSCSGIKFLSYLTHQSPKEIRQNYLNELLRSQGRLGTRNNKNNNTQLSAENQEQEQHNVLSIFKNNIIKDSWKNPLSDNAKKYLTERRIFDAPFINHHNFYSITDKFNNEYILIPWEFGGYTPYYQINNFLKTKNDKYPALSQKYIFPKNKEKIIYGLDNIDLRYKKIICFEGVYDSLFVKNGVAIGGKHLTALQEKILQERYPKFEICISYDNDLAGITEMKNMLKKNPMKYKYFIWFNKNTQAKDINDYIKLTNDVNMFSQPDDVNKLIYSGIQLKWMFNL